MGNTEITKLMCSSKMPNLLQPHCPTRMTEAFMNSKDICNRYATGERDFSNLNLSETNLSGANLNDIDLHGTNLSVANLSGIHLMRANLNHAKLNVARLSGANLVQAQLYQAILNVANLAMADLREAQMRETLLFRAELMRADLSRANLKHANLNSADLSKATLRQTNLSYSNLTEANLEAACLTGAILEHCCLNGANLSRINISSANLRQAELKQANLRLANLKGADLRRVNLRWADLRGADLRWADLSGAKLSGANLQGADLSYANLTNTSLVHTDLTEARLNHVEWLGADLTGATLTGAKLYGVSRFGLKTAGMKCEWVDVSVESNRTKVYQFAVGEIKKFFAQTLPTVEISIDAPLDVKANLSLAWIYHHLSSLDSRFRKLPNIKSDSSRTTLSFEVTSNEELLTTTYLSIIPFQDAKMTHKNLIWLLQTLRFQDWENIKPGQIQGMKILCTKVYQAIEKVASLNQDKLIASCHQSSSFFHAPTHTVLINSSNQNLDLFVNSDFGRSEMYRSDSIDLETRIMSNNPESLLPSTEAVENFVKTCDFLERASV